MQVAQLTKHTPANDDRSALDALTALSDVAANLPRVSVSPSAQTPANTSLAATRPRRLSTSQRSRRLSDATAAANNPSRGALLSSPVPVSRLLSPPAPPMPLLTATTPSAINASSHKAKKLHRNQTFTCESCSKVYRHPNCLIKHRWEHSPHWREASKLLLSKHQQVQLLEAAAILTHISPPDPSLAGTDGTSIEAVSLGTSLPEDRSMWPYWVSRHDPVPIVLDTTPNATFNSKARAAAKKKERAVAAVVPTTGNSRHQKSDGEVDVVGLDEDDEDATDDDATDEELVESTQEEPSDASSGEDESENTKSTPVVSRPTNGVSRPKGVSTLVALPAFTRPRASGPTAALSPPSAYPYPSSSTLYNAHSSYRTTHAHASISPSPSSLPPPSWSSSSVPTHVANARTWRSPVPPATTLPSQPLYPTPIPGMYGSFGSVGSVGSPSFGFAALSLGAASSATSVSTGVGSANTSMKKSPSPPAHAAHSGSDGLPRTGSISIAVSSTLSAHHQPSYGHPYAPSDRAYAKYDDDVDLDVDFVGTHGRGEINGERVSVGRDSIKEEDGMELDMEL